MKKLLLALLTITASLTAAPKAVIFDWGDVLAFDDRSIAVEFLCQSLQLSQPEFEKINMEKRKAMAEGKSDIEFWQAYAQQKDIALPDSWAESYHLAIKASIGADPEMFALIDELKAEKIRVGLLSNIDKRYIKYIRDYGFYEPFDPCLLSGEMDIKKPDPKAYEFLLNAIALAAGDIVFIDDKEENIVAAKKMGIDGIVFTSPSQIRQELKARGLMQPKQKVIIIHGNSGSKPTDNWIPNVKEELEKAGITVLAPEFPDNDLARASIWIPYLHMLKADENTILVGHSSGAIASMRFAEKNQVLGTILIGSYYTTLGYEKEKLSGYFDDPWDWNAIKNNQQWIIQFASTDDPWIPIQEPRYVRDKLSSEYHEFNDQGHFGGDYNKQTFPELVEAIKAKLGL